MKENIKLVKISEAARFLDVSVMTIYRLIRKGRLTAYQVGYTKVKLSDLEELILSSKLK